MKALLLDTNAVIWFAEDTTSAEIRAIIEQAASENTVLVSPVTIYEITYLSRLGRLKLAIDAEQFVSRMISQEGVRIANIPAETARTAGELDTDVGDPLDRILMATAIAYDAVLVTHDRKILEFAAESKSFEALAC